ncbi:MAG TPA: CRTAC1 family protein, partial [Verrucomicrobia bacterium]|nr:CRTAC1 family protein [Verrucomicrobiota bacterium]
LWDQLNQADETGTPALILADFPFSRLILPLDFHKRQLEVGITVFEQNSGAPKTEWSPEEWKQSLREWEQQGYRLRQSEWRHAEFDTSSPAQPSSRFQVTLDLENTRNSVLLTVKTDLQVTWPPLSDGSRIPLKIELNRLEILQQRNSPFFEHILSQDITLKKRPELSDFLIVADLDNDLKNEIIIPGINLVINFDETETVHRQLLFEYPPSVVYASIAADFTGDRNVDFIGAVTEGLLLYRGKGEARFSSRPEFIRFSEQSMFDPFTLTAGDIDSDGDLDLWLGQYKIPYRFGQMPTPYYDANDGFPAFLLINDGKGQFTDQTEERGLASKRNRRMYSSSFVDLDDDSDLDLVMVSDFAGMDVFYNDGNGYFHDVTTAILDENKLVGMAHSIADFDGNGHCDMMVIGMTSFAADRLEFLNLGRPEFPEHQRMRPIMSYGNRVVLAKRDRFEPASFEAQLARTGWSWGVTAMDFDLDGDLDLYIANGHQSNRSVREHDSVFWRHDIYAGSSETNEILSVFFQAVMNRSMATGQSYGGYHKNQLFLNQQNTSFTNIGFLSGCGLETDSRNVLSDDFNSDGRSDLFLITYESWPENQQTLHVFKNRIETENHWIGFNLNDQILKKSPIGATVRLVSQSGQQIRKLVTGDSYRAQHSNRVVFGLGMDEHVKELRVKWPDGFSIKFENPEIDRYHLLQREY